MNKFIKHILTESFQDFISEADENDFFKPKKIKSRKEKRDKDKIEFIKKTNKELKEKLKELTLHTEKLKFSFDIPDLKDEDDFDYYKNYGEWIFDIISSERYSETYKKRYKYFYLAIYDKLTERFDNPIYYDFNDTVAFDNPTYIPNIVADISLQICRKINKLNKILIDRINKKLKENG